MLRYSVLFSICCASTTRSPAAVAEQESVVIVVGNAGTDEYGQMFGVWADRWQTAAEQGGANCRVLGRTSAQASDRDQLKELLSATDEMTSPLWLVFIGHGTFDGETAKFNLRGPDVSAAELKEWLANIQRPIAVINCASSSGTYVNELTGENRVLVTATKSGHEINFARFGDHLSATIGSLEGDLDKDGQTSLLEAFLTASARTAKFYETEGRLATEHALLEDNADGLGTPGDWFRGIRATKSATDGASVDGTRAHQWHLVRSAAEQRLTPKARAERDALELRIEQLRKQKNELPIDTYYQQLEDLLVPLARLYALEESTSAVEEASPQTVPPASPPKAAMPE